MRVDISRFKPSVTRNTLLVLSACLWSLVGILLFAKGTVRLISFDVPSTAKFSVLIMALIVGSLKSYFILDRSARRGIIRILEFKDGTCLGAVYSIKTWALVLCMMGLGIILRNSSLPTMLLCFIYFTVGWSLLLSSRLAWWAWCKAK